MSTPLAIIQDREGGGGMKIHFKTVFSCQKLVLIIFIKGGEWEIKLILNPAVKKIGQIYIFCFLSENCIIDDKIRLTRQVTISCIYRLFFSHSHVYGSLVIPSKYTRVKWQLMWRHSVNRLFVHYLGHHSVTKQKIH